MSFQTESAFINLLTTDERLNSNEFSLKIKKYCRDDVNNENEEAYNINLNNTKKYIKNDVLLSNYNINHIVIYCKYKK